MARSRLQCRRFNSTNDKERERVSQAVLELQGSNDESDPNTRAAMVMVGAAFVGPDVDRLVLLTGYTHEYVDQIAIRLKTSDLWQEGNLNYDPWDHEEKGLVAYVLDLEVATGRFIRSEKTTNGQYKFKLVQDPDNVPNMAT